MVYVKPKGGEKGKGVMRARKLRGLRRYELRFNQKTRKAYSVAALHRLIRRHKKSGAYIIQQGIRMMKYRGRSFDIRVMTQRKSTKSSWVMTGMCARVAASGLIVTNTSQGGDVLPVWTVLRANMSRKRARSMTGRIERLSLRIARRYAKKRPRSVVFGVDIAVDRKRRVWMLELNTKPGLVPFRYLKDKSMYRRMLKYRRRK
jgi:glutathione synthase/RimK-type ligase-like ATP-grasp enzyme